MQCMNWILYCAHSNMFNFFLFLTLLICKSNTCLSLHWFCVFFEKTGRLISSFKSETFKMIEENSIRNLGVLDECTQCRLQLNETINDILLKWSHKLTLDGNYEYNIEWMINKLSYSIVVEKQTCVSVFQYLLDWARQKKRNW